ncbi:MAG TPA: type II secretion system minor pseudopilin GspK [Pseudomonas sp.]|nr:type II secretion system minor pseudopilin GspK [Pseudomonas sp.]
MKRRQRGVALITVLLVVAIVTVVCAGLIARQQLAIRASSNQIQARQALQYALGGEALAQGILARDLKAPGRAPGPGVDHPQEAWARPLPTFPIEQGEITVRIEDLSGRFNLNSLVQARPGVQQGEGGDPQGAAGGEVNSAALRQFRRLLVNLGIEQPAYANRLVDWLDNRPERYQDSGAEDNEYLLAEPAYRAGNRRIEDISELRLLLGMTDEDYRRLLPHVSALPSDAALNVNTASAMVLASLRDNLTPGAAQALVQGRPAEGYRTLDEFTQILDNLAPPGAGASENEPVDPNASGEFDPGNPQGEGASRGQARLALNSQYFQVIAEVRVADRRQVMVSTLQREAANASGGAGNVRVLQRNFGLSVQLTPAAARKGS